MIPIGEREFLGETQSRALVVNGRMTTKDWWNDIDWEITISGRKTLFSVGGRCMNEYGTLVE
jgi:hypothetical protein